MFTTRSIQGTTSLSKGCFALLAFLPLLAASTINVGASLTAHDPINTRPTRVEVSHTSPHSLPLRYLTPPLHDTPLLQDILNGRGATQDDNEEKRDHASTTGYPYSQPPPPPPPPTSLYPSSPPPPPSPSPPPATPTPTPPSPQHTVPHQSLNRFQSSTSMRLFQSSSLRQPDPQIRPYVMKEYLLPRKPYRVSSPPQFSSSLQKSPKSTTSPKKSLPHPPYPIPSLPPSSPPPLVPLWPDPPPPPAIPPSSRPSSPPSPPPTPSPSSSPVLSQDLRSSTMVFLDHSNPSGGRQRRVGLAPDIPGVRRKHSKIPEIPKEDPPQPLGFGGGSSSGFAHLRSHIHLGGRDKNRSFLRRYKLFNQKRMQPAPLSGYQHMDEQNYQDTPEYPSIPEESLMPKRGPENASELQPDRINITTTLETFLNYPPETWENQLSENLPKSQSTGEEDVLEGNLENEIMGMQLGEDPTAVMAEEEEEEEEEEGREEDREEKPFPNKLEKPEEAALPPARFNPSYKDMTNKNEQDVIFTDATHLSDRDYDYDSDSQEIANVTTADPHRKVNLEKLERELSKKDEEAASDLLLAISILQHHMIPSLQNEDESTTSKADNSSKQPESNDVQSTSNSKDQSFSSGGGRSHRKGHHNYNIEIFDTMSASSEEDLTVMKDITHSTSNESVIFQPVHEVPLLPEHQSCYRWFVLVLDGNCSVIKQRMTAFVTFLKAALSSKLSVDYNDVYVPSVFCDNTFMVNISLDTIKNPQAEIKLRLLAEANTTLLEISEEIFYLEKILTKRTAEDDGQDLQPLVKKPDDVELVIYIAVGCMCVFILLSVVIVALIRLCRQEGDQLDIGKTIPHQHVARSFDFPIRRPNVIYSHRFSQALTPDKCAAAATHGMENNPSNGGGGGGGNGGGGGGGGRGSVGVMTVTGSGRGSVLRYDTEFAGEHMVGDEEYYSMAAPSMDELYNDRRALVPSRRRATKVPGEEVIMEEDIVEEEEEDLEEDEDDEEDDDDDEEEDVEEDDGEEEGDERKTTRRANITQEEILLGDEEEEDDDDDAEQCHFQRSDALKAASSSSHTATECANDSASIAGKGNTCEENPNTVTGSRNRAGPNTEKGNAITENTGESTPNASECSPSKPSGMVNTGRGLNNTTNSDMTNTNTGNTDGAGSRTNDLTMNKLKKDKTGTNTGVRGTAAMSAAGNKAKGLLGSRMRSRKTLLPGNEVVFTGIDNPCYNR